MEVAESNKLVLEKLNLLTSGSSLVETLLDDSVHNPYVLL